MTKTERDILRWLAVDQRPLSHLLAFTSARAGAWIRSNGGTMKHIDAYIRIFNEISDTRPECIEGQNVVRFRA